MGSFGSWLKTTRQSKNLSQAAASKAAGMSEATWQRLETDQPRIRPLSHTATDSIGEAFGVPGALVRAHLEEMGTLSSFAKKLIEDRTTKEAVARRAADFIFGRLTSYNQLGPILIGDGSSAALVGEELLHRWIHSMPDALLDLRTNNLEVVLRARAEIEANESLPLKLQLSVAPGAFLARSCATCGDDTIDWVEHHAPRCLCVLSTSILVPATVGPYSNNQLPSSVKQAIVKNASDLLVVASAAKLSYASEDLGGYNPTLFQNMRIDWEERLATRRVWVVTNLDTVVNNGLNHSLPDPAFSPEQHRQWVNARELYLNLKERFMVADV